MAVEIRNHQSHVARPARTNRDTPERWQAALNRAIAAGIDALEVGGVGGFAVESATSRNVVYLVDSAGVTCTCKAAQASDPCCLHRAVVRYFLGTLPGVAPVPPAPPAADAKCMECNGGGVIWDNEVAKYGGWHPTCHVCGGSGKSRRFAA